MNRAKILGKLSRNIGHIERRFSVRSLAVFGPVARNEMRRGGDIDVLVEFTCAPTFDNYMDLKFYLEELFGAPVDLVTTGAVKPRMRALIEANRIDVA